MAGNEFKQALEDLDAGARPAAEGGPAGESGDAAAHASVAALRERFGAAILDHRVMAGDEHVVYIPAARVLEILGWLHSDSAQRYDYLQDLTAVDWGGGRPLEVVYQLWSIPHRRALRIKAALPLSALEIDSVWSIWKTADWLERETWDMFGIRFRGHPDLRRILMPDTYAEGYPLRKDFPLRGRFSRAEQTRRALAEDMAAQYSASELKVAADVAAHVHAMEAMGEEAEDVS
jgi:NADH-quinone oxidoreductase subunit C